MTPLEFSSFFRGQFQDWVRKFLASDEFSRVQAELLSLAASAGFKPGLSMHQTKDEFTTVLKKMSNFMPGAQDRLAEDSPLDDRVTTKESTVTPTSKSLELSANINLTASAVASEHNEEMVNAEVDGSEPKMTDDTVAAKSGYAFVPGIFFALKDDVELVEVGSGRASSGLNDVVVALSVGEKGDGLVPSSAAGEEAAPNSSRWILSHATCPRPNGFCLGTCSIAGQATAELITPDLICPSTYQLLRNSSGDSGLNLSFDKSASLKRLFGLARGSLVGVLSFHFSSGVPGETVPHHIPPSLGVLVLSGLSRVWKNRLCDSVLRGADGNGIGVMGIHDFLCLPEWTGAEVQEKPHFDVRSTLQRLPFYCTPPAAADAVIPDPTPEDLTAGTPSSKILAKVEASQKRKASTSGATSGHVAKRTRSSLAQLTSRNQGGSSAASATEGSNTRDSRGKGIMVDDAAAPSGGAS
ncbi:hypothetical protein Tco_0403438 [Tanacetum coccineum]